MPARRILRLLASPTQPTGRSSVSVDPHPKLTEHCCDYSRCWIYDRFFDQARAVSNRIHAITGLDVEVREDYVSSAEPLQVVNYGLGGHYYEHMDSFDGRRETGPQWLKEAGNRIATFLLYLSDVEKGGSTVFVNANISVAPVKGMALFWYNYRPDYNAPDTMTTHCGCPVLIGQKWIATKWIWEYGNTFRWPCGQTPSDTQLDLDLLLLDRDRLSERSAGFS